MSAHGFFPDTKMLGNHVQALTDREEAQHCKFSGRKRGVREQQTSRGIGGDVGCSRQGSCSVAYSAGTGADRATGRGRAPLLEYDAAAWCKNTMRVVAERLLLT
jgi:hypothetical protein